MPPANTDSVVAVSGSAGSSASNESFAPSTYAPTESYTQYSVQPQNGYHPGLTAHPRTWFAPQQGAWLSVQGQPFWIPATAQAYLPPGAPHPLPPPSNPFIPASHLIPTRYGSGWHVGPFGTETAPSPYNLGSMASSLPSLDPHTSRSQLHPDLSVNSPLQWTLVRPPASAKGRMSNDWENYGKWATDPAFADAETLTVRFDHLSPLFAMWMRAWGPIHITKSRHSPGGSMKAITVEDVLEGIYAYFQIPLDTESDEYKRLPILDLNMVLSSRYRRVPCDSRIPLGDVSLRLDTLNGFLDFAGLRVLHVSQDRVALALDLELNHAWAQWPSGPYY